MMYVGDVKPTTTVLIPTFNEAASIVGCLEALAAQSVELAHLEVVVADGGSTDGTATVARCWLAERWPGHWTVLDAGPGSTPKNLNAGLAAAGGRYIVRVDARSRVPGTYIASVCEILQERPDVAVVGGAQVARPSPGAGTVERAIARALNNRLAMGGSRYRSRAASGPSDTVYLGAFRRDQLRAVGGWDTRFATNQDFDLNRRLSQLGTVWFDAQLAVDYLPRRTFIALAKQYHRFGRWKVRYWRWTRSTPEPRQMVLLLVPWLIGAMGVVGLRRRPAQVVLCSAVGAVILEVRGQHVGATLSERLLALVANVVVAGSWHLGIVHEAILGVD